MRLSLRFLGVAGLFIVPTGAVVAFPGSDDVAAASTSAPQWTSSGFSGSSGFSSVACPSPTECLAVGTQTPMPQISDSSATTGFLADGRWRFSQQSSPNQDVTLAAISCPSSNECVAVGFKAATMSQCNSFGSCQDVASNARDAKFGPLVEMWNGQVWSSRIVSMPPTEQGGQFTGVSCPTVSRCIAVGGFTAGGAGDSGPLAEIWNGGSWRSMRMPGSPRNGFADLNAVSCSGPSSCVAVGQGGRQARSGDLTDQPYAEVWHGGDWNVVATHAHRALGASYFQDVDCSTSAICIAVGTAGTEGLSGIWNGSSWRELPLLRVSANTVYLST